MSHAYYADMGQYTLPSERSSLALAIVYYRDERFFVVFDGDSYFIKQEYFGPRGRVERTFWDASNQEPRFFNVMYEQ